MRSRALPAGRPKCRCHGDCNMARDHDNERQQGACGAGPSRSARARRW
jgi:hypothetical protein